MNLDQLTIYSFQFREDGERYDDPFIVACPKPYIINLSGYTQQERESKVNDLLASVQNLRVVLASLGIVESEAYAKDYSLNRRTWDTLYDLVLAKGNHKLAKRMRENYGKF